MAGPSHPSSSPLCINAEARLLQSSLWADWPEGGVFPAPEQSRHPQQTFSVLVSAQREGSLLDSCNPAVHPSSTIALPPPAP